MNTTNHTFTGGEHYWIRWHNGTYEVRREIPYEDEDHETVFKGHYNSCLNFLKEIVYANVDYDLNL